MNTDICQLLLTVMIAGFTLICAILLIIWNFLNKRMDKFEDRMSRFEDRMNRFEDRMSRFEDRMSRFEHDMTEIKTILRMKECCMIQDERQLKKAE